jgi:hypothetical protein
MSKRLAIGDWRLATGFPPLRNSHQSNGTPVHHKLFLKSASSVTMIVQKFKDVMFKCRRMPTISSLENDRLVFGVSLQEL